MFAITDTQKKLQIKLHLLPKTNKLINTSVLKINTIKNGIAKN